MLQINRLYSLVFKITLISIDIRVYISVDHIKVTNIMGKNTYKYRKRIIQYIFNNASFEITKNIL